MDYRALVQKLGDRTNQNSQTSELILEHRTGHPNYMTKIMSNSKERLNDKAQRFFEDSSTVQEPMVAYRHDYATEAHNEFEEYPFMTSCNNDELVNHILAHEEEYARTGNAVDFLEMMADFKNEFEW